MYVMSAKRWVDLHIHTLCRRERSLPTGPLPGYDVVILSDLLHFDASHDVLLSSLTSLLRKTANARTYVAAGKYTPEGVCRHFLDEGSRLGLSWEEGREDEEWRGTLEVGGGVLSRAQLGVRKGMCRWWTGRWTLQTSHGGET